MSGPDPSRRSETSRRAVLEAALAQLQDASYSRLTIEGIAARAGVGKQTIYRWWPSKAAIIFDAFLMLNESDVQGPPALPDTGDLHADLTVVLRATASELNDPRLASPMRVLASEVARDPALAEAYHERLEGPLRQAKRERLRSAQEAGQVAADLDLDLAVDLIWGPIFSRWLQRAGVLDDDYVDSLLGTALAGLRPRG